jgi:hypothetical protein
MALVPFKSPIEPPASFDPVAALDPAARVRAETLADDINGAVKGLLDGDGAPWYALFERYRAWLPDEKEHAAFVTTATMSAIEVLARRCARLDKMTPAAASAAPAASGLSYAGVWTATQTYQANELTTH